MVDVPASKVKLRGDTTTQPMVLQVIVDEPSDRARSVVPETIIRAPEKLYPAVSISPIVRLRLPAVFRVNALPSDHPQPYPLMITSFPKETPLVVIVLPAPVPVSVIAPV